MEKSLLNALQSLFVVSIGALVGLIGFAASAAASAPYTDNFDSYTVGGLQGQGGWSCISSPCNVVTTQSDSAPNSIENGLALHSGTATATGAAFTSVYWTTGAGYVFFTLKKSDSEHFFIGAKDTDFYSYNDGNFIHPFGGLNVNAWNRIGIEWRYSDKNVRFYLNGLWSSWYNYTNYWNDGVYPENIEITGASNVFFDSITDTETVVPPAVAGYEPILTPTAPVRNTETVVDFGAGFTVSGNVQIPTLNSHSYQKLVVTFRKPDALVASHSLVFDLGALIAGQSLAYSATTTVPVTTSGDNFFKVSYTINGSKYATSQPDNPPVSSPLLYFDNTWVKDSANAAPADLITSSQKPAQEALEDCGVYSGIDAVVCNLKNFIVGAFLPSDAAINQFNSTMNGFKTKFPMNYAAAINDTLTAIGAGVSDTSGFSFNLYGNAGTVDTSFFSQDLGAGVTIGGTIKLILTFLVFVVFLIWGVGYMHRIFN
jgi:hypothetical protein